MATPVRITLYDVSRCGYYEYGSNDPSFGGLPVVLEDLNRWITDDGPKVIETKTFTPAADSDHLPVYCFSITHDETTNDYLLVTWNETETVSGKYAAVQGEDTAGEATVETADVSVGSIPGFPTYFLFLTNENKLATVCTERRNGHPGMNRYLTGYLERFSRFVVRQTSDEPPLTIDIEGYGDRENPTDSVTPRFESTRVKNYSELALIRSRRPQIRKLIRKDAYGGGRVTQQRRILKWMFKGLGLPTEDDNLPATRYRYELPFRPTEDQLNGIISAWQAQSDEADNWADIGFETTEAKTHWLRSSLAQAEYELNLTSRYSAVFDEASMLAELRRIRPELLRVMRRTIDE